MEYEILVNIDLEMEIEGGPGVANMETGYEFIEEAEYREEAIEAARKFAEEKIEDMKVGFDSREVNKVEISVSKMESSEGDVLFG